MSKAHRITIEGNAIVDDHDRRTIALFRLHNGTDEEMRAIADRANAAGVEQQNLEILELAASFERRAKTPTNGATSAEFLLAAAALRLAAQPRSPQVRLDVQEVFSQY